MAQIAKKLVKVYKTEIKSVDVDAGTVTALVSTKSVDRDGEVVLPSAIKKRIELYMAHPVLLSSHRYDDLLKQIGICEDIKCTPSGVTARFKYFHGQGNPEADWAFTLAKNGIAAYSIGFMAHEWEDKEVDGDIHRHFTDVELVEISQVLVPSNRDALASRRSSECEIEKELVELAIVKCFGESEPKPVEVVPAPVVEPEPAKPAAPVAEAAPAPIVENPAPSTEVTTDVAKQLLENDEFLTKLAEKLSTKARPTEAKDDEGYFKGVIDAPDGSPKGAPKNDPDISALFSESTNRHFKTKE
jgi:HK97 family phage prohead protease